MAGPEIRGDVDETTGRRSVDALPRIRVPQHSLVNDHKAVEAGPGGTAG